MFSTPARRDEGLDHHGGRPQLDHHSPARRVL